MSFFRRGDLPEPPPEDIAAKGLNPAYTVKREPTIADLDAYCRANHVDANDAYHTTRFLGCVIPEKQEVVLPADGVFDPQKQAALQAHEYAHTWGLVHHDGKGWFEAPGLSSFDWSKVLGTPAAPETAATAPKRMFGAR